MVKSYTGETGPTPRYGQPVKKELEKAAADVEEQLEEDLEAVEDKGVELQQKSTPKLLKEQKADIMDKLDEVQDAIENAENPVQALQDAGYKIFPHGKGKDFKVEIDVKEDGQFLLSSNNIAEIREEVRKHFPDKPAGKPNVNLKERSSGGKDKPIDIAHSRGSLEENQRMHDMAKDNYETSQAGKNEKLKTLFAKEFEKEKEILAIAKEQNWPELQAQWAESAKKFAEEQADREAKEKARQKDFEKMRKPWRKAADAVVKTIQDQIAKGEQTTSKSETIKDALASIKSEMYKKDVTSYHIVDNILNYLEDEIKKIDFPKNEIVSDRELLDTLGENATKFIKDTETRFGKENL